MCTPFCSELSSRSTIRIMPNGSNQHAWIYWEIAGADSPIRRNPAPGIISGFFEWKQDGQRKHPFRIHLRDESIMSVAGIWDAWRQGTPDERWSFSIMTTAANSFMSEIHDRMPVILGRSEEDAWLDPEIHER